MLNETMHRLAVVLAPHRPETLDDAVRSTHRARQLLLEATGSGWTWHANSLIRREYAIRYELARQVCFTKPTSERYAEAVGVVVGLGFGALIGGIFGWPAAGELTLALPLAAAGGACGFHMSVLREAFVFMHAVSPQLFRRIHDEAARELALPPIDHPDEFDPARDTFRPPRLDERTIALPPSDTSEAGRAADRALLGLPANATFEMGRDALGRAFEALTPESFHLASDALAEHVDALLLAWQRLRPTLPR